MGCIRIVIVRVVGGTMHYTGRVRSREINEQTNYFIYYVAFCVPSLLLQYVTCIVFPQHLGSPAVGHRDFKGALFF